MLIFNKNSIFRIPIGKLFKDTISIYIYIMDNTDISIDGYIDVVYNEVYQHYGDNVYKVGKSKQVIARLSV